MAVIRDRIADLIMQSLGDPVPMFEVDLKDLQMPNKL